MKTWWMGLASALMIFGANAFATETNPSVDFAVERVLFISSNYAATGDRGEVWVKLNLSITTFHSGCDGPGQTGYLVAAFSDDVFGKQFVSGLLTAKASGATIKIGIDDSRKNSRGMCFLTFYEVQS